MSGCATTEIRAVNFFRTASISLAAFSLTSTTAFAADANPASFIHELAHAPAPADNPLKGFVPYARQGKNFPHSLEFNYLPLRDLMVGPDRFNWQPMEKLLDDIAGRGCQAVVRVYQEYPGKPISIPKFLIEDGLTVRRWKNTNTAPFPAQFDHTPDYEDPRMRAALKSFIAAFGKRYDGDPRLGYVTAGLLGTWGEWHCYPHTEWFASKEVQAEVMTAYEEAFETTPILLRYPAGPHEWAHAPNFDRRFGYHDDSFAWATIPTGRKEDEWFFMPAMKRGGEPATSKWRLLPIGGEIRPELWPCIWTAEGCDKGQNFDECVRQTHATWLMETSTSRQLSDDERARALKAARSLGYEFHVSRSEILVKREGKAVRVTLDVENRGVAPFYYEWPMELAVAKPDGTIVETHKTFWSLRDILPGIPKQWTGSIRTHAQLPGQYEILLRAVNPLPGGRPLRFANKSQDKPLKGWLGAGSFVIP